MTESLTCPKCGAHMKAKSRFCGGCDYERPIEEPKASVAAAVQQAMKEAEPFPEEVTKTRIIDVKNGVDKTAKPSEQPSLGEDLTLDVTKLEDEAKCKLEEYIASSKTRAAVPGKSFMPSKGVIAGILIGTLVICAGVGGYFWYHGSSTTTQVQPVVSTPVTPPIETPKPAEIPVVEQKQEVAQEPVVKPEPAKTADKPKVEPKKAQTANVTPRKPIEKKNIEVVRDTMPLKSTTSTISVKTAPAAEPQNVGHVVGEVQSWLRSNGFNVVAAVKDDKLVVKGSATTAEKTKIMTKVRGYGVPVRDLVVEDIN